MGKFLLSVGTRHRRQSTSTPGLMSSACRCADGPTDSGRRTPRGFTLLEVLLYLAIISVTLLAAASLSFEFVHTRARAIAFAEVNRNTRLAISRVVAEIREAQAINTADSVFDDDGGRLSLGVVPAGHSPTVFFVQDGRLYVQRGSDPAVALTSSRVVVDEFRLTDLTQPIRTRSVGVRIKITFDTDIQQYASTATVEVTTPVRRADGFGN